ncbi:MAG: Hsp70 family protein [Deltaproteobacteria bacterium]|nr:Hsp70 family protein [Deltaproteobacteria bacterium]
MAVIGIDLGTTNSVVATVKDGQVIVVPDAQGRHLHPSVVSFGQDGVKLFSHEAVGRRIVAPEYTVYSAKRIIGMPFHSPEVQAAIARMPYKLIEGTNEQAVFVGPDRQYTIPEISGQFLSYVKQCAEFYLGEDVTGAVLTVPANFNDAQRRATMDAGRIAGLDVMRILNEPTAAALAYGVGRNMSRRLAVFDFGGGTFDVTILQVENDVFEVLATGGDMFLGGDDFDHILMGILAEQCLHQTGVDPRGHSASRARLLLAAEQVKRHLSDKPVARGELKQMAVGGGGQPLHLRFEVTREQFDQAASELVARTLHTCQAVLQAAQLTVTQIDEVIMVGGSTRIPLVRTAAQRFFGGPPRTDLNPDEVVGWGAAIQADNLAYGSGDVASRAVLLDVTPRALGIAVAGGFAETIIERNVPLPVEQSRMFSTSADYQTSVRIQVCQGESRQFDENYPLGDLELTGLRPARRGELSIEVTFRVDTDGILRVRARDMETGRAQEAQVNVRGSMSAQDVADAAGRRAAEMENLPDTA